MRVLPLVLAAAVAGAVALSSAWADPPAPYRFELKPVDGGFLRLDRGSGQTAFCAPSKEGYVCRPTAEGRSPDAAMIAGLEKRVEALEARIRRLDDDPTALKRAPARDPTLDLPTDEQVDRVASFLERTLRRFKRLAADMQKDMGDGRL